MEEEQGKGSRKKEGKDKSGQLDEAGRGEEKIRVGRKMEREEKRTRYE